MKKKIIIAIIVLSTLAAGVFFKGSSPVEYEGYTVSLGDVIDYFEEDGIIKYASETNIVSLATGKVNSVYFEEGQSVKEGDVLLDIDSSDIEFQIKSLEENIKSMEYQYKDALNPVDKAEIEKLETVLSQAKNNMEITKKEFERSSTLFEQGAISSVELENAKNSFDNSKSQVDIANSQLTLGKVRISKYKEKQILASIEAQKYQLENLRLSKSYCQIKAPFDGYVVVKLIDSNDFVTTGQKVFEIVNMDKILIESEILSKYYENVEIGTEVLLNINDNKLDGKVSKIYPKANEKISDLGISQRRILVEISPEESIERFVINQELDVRYFTSIGRNVLRIPKSSVFSINDMDYVFISDGSKIILRDIKIGKEGKKYYEVLEGLLENDNIVRYPDKELEENMKIDLIYTEEQDEY